MADKPQSMTPEQAPKVNSNIKYLSFIPSIVAILLLTASVYLFYTNQTLKGELSKRTVPLQPEVTPTPSVQLLQYEHKLDDVTSFSLNYPKGSQTEEKQTDDKKFTLTIKPPAPYYTATTVFELSVNKQLPNKSIEYYQPSKYVSALQAKNKELIAGILPVYIDRLPTQEFYSVTCPELGSVCEKKDIYYINPLNYFFTITTTHFTDTDGNQMRNKVLDDIVASLKFSQNKP